METVCELTDMDSYGSVAQFRPINGWDFYERDASSYCSGWDNDYFDQHNFGYACEYYLVNTAGMPHLMLY